MTSTQPGPALPQDSPGLSAARRRVLQSLVDAGSTGATVIVLTGRLGGHANSLRHHLTALVTSGLAVEATEEPAGRGRPARIHRATPAGRRALLGADTGGYRDLAAALATATADHPHLARDAGRQWGRQLAGDRTHATGPDGVGGDLVALLNAQGFSTVADGPGQWAMRTCPLVDAAREHPEAVCGLHESMLQGILDRWGSTERATVEPFALPGGCRLLLRGAQARSTPTPTQAQAQS